MYPLDFEEFLWAVGQKEAAGIIHDSFSTFSPCSLHETFIDYYRTYLFTGGMPQVVKEYIENHDPMMAGEIKRGINEAYIADMARYAGKAETVRIISVYNSLTAQLAKANHKFQYKVIKSGARIAEYGSSIDWLKASGIVLACQKVSEGHMPLSAYSDPAAFKLYHSDTGLLCAMAGLTEKSITAERLTGSGFIGALAENYVAKSLKAAGYALYYWESKGKAEVDFIILIRRYSPPFSYRVSEKNFGNENNIRSIPLYALFCV